MRNDDYYTFLYKKTQTHHMITITILLIFNIEIRLSHRHFFFCCRLWNKNVSDFPSRQQHKKN